MTGNLALVSVCTARIYAIKTDDFVLNFRVLSKMHMGIIKNWLHYTDRYTHAIILYGSPYLCFSQSYTLCECMWRLIIIIERTHTHTHARLFY